MSAITACGEIISNGIISCGNVCRLLSSSTVGYMFLSDGKNSSFQFCHCNLSTGRLLWALGGIPLCIHFITSDTTVTDAYSKHIANGNSQTKFEWFQDVFEFFFFPKRRITTLIHIEAYYTIWHLCHLQNTGNAGTKVTQQTNKDRGEHTVWNTQGHAG